MAGTFRFSFGPWNIHEGADPCGPPVRDTIAFSKKLGMYKKLGFSGVQLHDDDAVADIDRLKPEQIKRRAKALAKKLRDEGLQAEFIAPRLWADPRTIDGGFTSNSASCRRYAIERSLRAIDLASELGTRLIVLWLAREGTYMRESKDSKTAFERIAEGISKMLEYNRDIRIAIEPKPSEPVDLAYAPTTGHAISISTLTADPARVGVNIESAHSIIAGLDPSDEMGLALACKKLFTVHLNDQNGTRFDQDKTFGSVCLRRAFNQVRILDKYNYGKSGEWVGMDVQALRTQKHPATKHLSNSRTIFLRLLEISRGLDEDKIERMRKNRDYESLEIYIVERLMGEK